MARRTHHGRHGRVRGSPKASFRRDLATATAEEGDEQGGERTNLRRQRSSRLIRDTFLRVAGALARIPAGASAEEAWLARVLVNLQRDAWRRSKVRVDHDARARRSNVSIHPESALVASATLWSALNALPPRRRAVVVVHELEGLPVRTVASLLGVTAVTVRWHLFRARGDLSVARNAPGRTR